MLPWRCGGGLPLLCRAAAFVQLCVGLQASLFGGFKGFNSLLRGLGRFFFRQAQVVEGFGADQCRHGFGPACFGLLQGLGQTVEPLAGLSDIFFLLGLCLPGGLGLTARHGQFHGALRALAFAFICRGAGLLGGECRAFRRCGNGQQGFV